MKIFIDAGLEYIKGYLRYGHMEGIVNIPDEDYEQFQSDPVVYIKEHDLQDYLDLIVDDWSVEDCGNIDEINYREV